MDSIRPAAARFAAGKDKRPSRVPRAPHPDAQPRRSNAPLRKYEVAYLNGAGKIEYVTRMAPALPVFEDAFGALGHGAILQTETGPVAVEDLHPGDRIRVANGGYETLLWRGAITIKPDDPNASPETSSLIRKYI